jgi:uncharacterized delta-60 repeat protein
MKGYLRSVGQKPLLIAISALALMVPCAPAAAQAPALGSSSGGAMRQDDGRIVAIGGGDSCVLPGTGCPGGFAVTRQEASGAPDPSFGNGGRVDIGVAAGTATAVAIDSQGRIVVAGTAATAPFPRAESGLALARLLPDGSLDASFGNGGVTSAAIAGASLEARGVALAGDGAILVSTPYRTSSGADLAVARFSESGSLDAGFGSNGIARTSGTGASIENVGPIAVQPDGKALVGATTRTETFTRFLAVARFAANGALDSSFGEGGVFSGSPVTSEWGQADIRAVFADATGHVLLAGNERTGEHCCTEAIVTRLDPTGRVDAGFGEAGGGTSGLRNASLLTATGLADGSVFLAGSSGHGLVVARLGADGGLDPTFNAGGKGVVAVAGLNTSAEAAFPEPGGGALALALVREAHCRVPGQARWRSCNSEATISFRPNGFLRHSFGGVGFITRPRIHYCPELPGTACGIDISERQLEGLAGRGSPRKAHLKTGQVLIRVRCDRRVETRCRISTGLRLGQGGGFTSEVASVRAGHSRLLQLPAPRDLAARLAAAGSELRLPLRQRLSANGISVGFKAGIRLLRR